MDWEIQKRDRVKPQSNTNLRLNVKKQYFNKPSPNSKKPNIAQKYTPQNLTKANVAMGKAGNQSSSNTLLQTGMNVSHERFGKGKILQIEGQAGNKKATIFFERNGQKTLLLKFAKLTIIN